MSQLKQGSESPWPLARCGLESKHSASDAGWPTGQSMVQGDQLALAMLWDRGKQGLALPLCYGCCLCFKIKVEKCTE